MRPRASVVIPVYNRAQSVLPTLQSVRDQSMTEFECIVVDDGSADGEELRAVVQSLGDDRFRYIRRENGGGGAARNTGISEAKGEFVAFLDSDDRWLPEKLAVDSNLAARGSVLFSPVIMVCNGKLGDVRPKRPPKDDEPLSDYLVRGQGWVPTSTLVIPANVKSRFSEFARFGQDTDFALKLAHEGYRFFMHPEPLAMVCDTEDRSRLSRSGEWERACIWLDEVSDLMTPRSVLAYRGWHIARMAAEAGKRRIGLIFWWRAFVHGAFPLPLAAKALIQVIVPRPAYKWAKSMLGPVGRFST